VVYESAPVIKPILKRGRARIPMGLTLLVAVIVLGIAGAAVAESVTSGEVGPSLHLTASGHLLQPAGRLTTVGDFPTGSAVLPGGRFLWVADCGHGEDDVKVVDLRDGAVAHTLPLPGCYGGVAFSPDGGHAYVSGTPTGSSPTEGPTKGGQGDVIHIFNVNPSTGQGVEGNPLQLPATTGGSARTNSLPPVSGVGTAQPEGLAVSPDGGHLIVALNGADDAVVVNLHTLAQTVVPVGRYPEGVAFDPQGRAYVSNEYDGTVSVIDPQSTKVTATISGLGGALGDLASHPEGMVADPRRPLLYVAVTNRDLVAVVDTTTDRVTQLVGVGRTEGLGTEPTSVAISPDDGTLYSSDAGEDAIAAISLDRRPSIGTPRGHRVYTAVSLKTISTYRSQRAKAVRALANVNRRVSRALRAQRQARRAARRAQRTAHRRYLTRLRYLSAHYLRPRAAIMCNGPSLRQEKLYVRRLLRALAVKNRGRRRALIKKAQAALPVSARCVGGNIPNLPAYRLIGRIPTAAYPNSVQTTPEGQLIWVAGKGFGSGPNPTYFFSGAKTPLQTPPNAYGTYVLDLLIGRVGALALPTDVQVVADTATADAQSKPANAESKPAGSPIPAATGHPSPQIKHVFYIVRENRTYDQVFGSDPRGDGNPQLELFGDNGVGGAANGITPNAHAITRQFQLLDHFYEDSEVSVDGHLITAGAEATDYVQKATAANYSNRRGTDDFGIYPVTFPPKFFIFDQAAKQGISFRDYGEAVGTIPLGAAPNRPELSTVESNVDTSYPNNVFIGCLKAGSKASCTQDSGIYNGAGTLFAGQSRFNEWYPQFQSQVLAGTVPSFNYMILPNDHTNGTTASDPTPQAFIADNDLALGQIVDAISHSSIWPSTAIFVEEDDSQDGADHVDSHRSPALVISPWARHGAVVHTRYDQYSMLRTAELILGLDPLALNDALATPMYDAFISGSAKPDDSPYTVRTPQYPLTSTNASTAADAKLSGELPWNRLDAVPQAISDEILWASEHGKAPAPQAGPDASPDEVDRAAIVRQMLRADPNVFHQVARPRSARATTTSCPITWACRPNPAGDG
jgi:YVTN family beta-propeller protein